MRRVRLIPYVGNLTRKYKNETQASSTFGQIRQKADLYIEVLPDDAPENFRLEISLKNANTGTISMYAAEWPPGFVQLRPKVTVLADEMTLYCLKLSAFDVVASPLGIKYHPLIGESFLFFYFR